MVKPIWNKESKFAQVKTKLKHIIKQKKHELEKSTMTVTYNNFGDKLK